MSEHRGASTPDEIGIIHNAALGAYALWRFGVGHQDECGSPPLVRLSFLVLPIVLHKPTLRHVESTRAGSGLALFAAKLGQERENLLAIHTRALAMRGLSLEAIGVAAATGLATLDHAEARIRSNTIGILRPDVPVRVRPIASSAEKLGRWFAMAGPTQVGMHLAVQF